VGVQWDSASGIHRLQENYDLVKREVLYIILLEFGITKKLVILVKMRLNETYSKVHVGKQFQFRMA
jgi:hypothetical protein